VLVLVIVLIATNLGTLGVLAWFLLRPADHPSPDDELVAPLAATPRPSSSVNGTRRLITIEILNPIELAGTRGRIVGIAGSLAPAITRRLVYDQALKLVRRQLAGERVVADVRLLVVRPEDSHGRAPQSAAVEPTVVASEQQPEPVDLGGPDDDLRHG
jgi:hypothetical protein